MIQKLDPAVLKEITDVILEHSRTPRNRLYEYPYNERESRELIARAESAARAVAVILLKKSS